ncbi:ricin-type beta-trefoil lectin domain protein [Kitasatospora purpeofusca]|uniref:ricin-type beta-trefoil lectin domain protein n=1 Tax=Kitasatospora purpeofusca TaxID=67352 RepID=UPI0004C0E614|nr:ricin-type beta-trefoil lectin domain protein [Kitasatospora purpeofusca]
MRETRSSAPPRGRSARHLAPLLAIGLVLAAPGAAFADPGATPTGVPTGVPTEAPTGAPTSVPTAQDAAPPAEQAQAQAPTPAQAADGPAPSTPSKLSVKPQPVGQGGDGCGAGAPGWIGKTVPLSDGTSDVRLNAWSGAAQPGVGTVTVGFRVWDTTAGESGDTGGVTRTSQSVVGTGGWGQATVGRVLADGHQYGWNAWTTGGGVNSPVTADCAFKVDLSAPTLASIAPSSVFPPQGSGAKPTGHAGDPGITVRVTSKDPVPTGCADGCLASGVREFQYTLDGSWSGVTGTVPASLAADGTAFADVPISVGAGNWGSHQLTVSAVDGAGNSDPRTAIYNFYAPAKLDRPDVAGDVDVDGVPDFLAPTADGSLALFRGGSGAASEPETVSPAASSPLHDDWNNYLLAHRGAVVGQGDSLFAYHKGTKQLFLYANDGNATPNPVFGRFTRTVGPVGDRTLCDNGIDGTWNHITRMAAVQRGTGGAGLVTVEQGHLRYYSNTRSGSNNCLNAGVELGAPGDDWSGFTLMYPGDISGIPTLWVRDTVTGAVSSLVLPLDPNGWPLDGSAPLPLPAHKPLLSALQGDGGASLCADIDHGRTGNGTAAVLSACSDQGAASSQAFTLGTDGSAHVLGKCLDVTDALTESGSPVNLWDCNNSPAQKWVAGPHPGTLMNPNAGKCLDAPGTAGPGTHLVIGDCQDAASDRWTVPATRAVLPLGLAAGVAPLVDSPGDLDADGHADLVVAFADGRKVRYPGIAPEGDLPRFGEPRALSAQPAGYNIGSIHAQGRCLDNYGASNNSALRLYDCWNGASQDFWFASDGTLRTGGRCVGVEDNRTDWGAPVVITDCQAATGQVWTFREDGSIYNPASDSCLELPGWNGANGTAVGIWGCYGNANQRWTLSPNTA